MAATVGSQDAASIRSASREEAMSALIAQQRVIRREIDLRIMIQSAIVVMVAIGVVVSTAVVAALPQIGTEVAMGFAVSTLLLSLHWMHNDIRHLQLGRYLATEIEPRIAVGFEGWECFHARLPRPTRLGSYWFVGTKGVLVAAPLCVAAIAYAESDGQLRPRAMLLVLLCAASTWILTRLPRVAPSTMGDAR